MKVDDAKRLFPILRQAELELDALIDSEAATPLRQTIEQLAGIVDSGMTELAIELRVFPADDVESDDAESAANRPPLRVLTRGLASVAGSPAYVAGGDCTWHRYQVRDEIRSVPHDQCPSCWKAWDDKRYGASCAFCGVRFGREVRLALDGTSCPECHEGRVSRERPTCGNCTWHADERCVHWIDE